MFGALTRAAERWRSIRLTGFVERRQMAALRQDLNHDDEAAVGLDPSRPTRAPDTGIPRSSRTGQLGILPPLAFLSNSMD